MPHLYRITIQDKKPLICDASNFEGQKPALEKEMKNAVFAYHSIEGTSALGSKRTCVIEPAGSAVIGKTTFCFHVSNIAFHGASF